MKRLGATAYSILLFLAAGIPAVSEGTESIVNSQSPGTAGAAETLVSEFRDAVYMDESDESLSRRFDILRARLEKLDIDPRERLYNRALVTYYMARGLQSLNSIDLVIKRDVYLRRGKLKKTRKMYDRLSDIISFYDEAGALASRYLSNGRDGRGVWLYTESLSHVVTLKSLTYLLNNGPKIRPLIEEAVELDSENPKIILLSANRYVYSPRAFGGNSQKGLGMLVNVYKSLELNREDRHNFALAIGFAYTADDKWADAIPYFQDALDVYPSNIFAAAMLELSRNGGHE